MKVVLASRNQGKLAEYRRMFELLGVEIATMDQAGVPADVELPEEADTFFDNAMSKAQALQKRIGGWTLADDSGLQVDALDGAPGVYSARFAGVSARGQSQDRANVALLLDKLSAVRGENRSARFVCVIVVLGPAGQLIHAQGTCEGHIVSEPRGSAGFGYDPVFMVTGRPHTMAELSMDEKNEISHRGRALSKLGDQIRDTKWC